MPGPTVTEQRQRIVSAYRDEGQLWPATMREVASWAIDSGLWEPAKGTMVGQLADELARAMREEFYSDPQGREVRTKHAARTIRDGIQKTLWDDIRSAHPRHMRIAFLQRRQQIVGDCKQLKTDVDSYNDNKNAEAPIQLVLDFTDDVLEAEALEGHHRQQASIDRAKLSQASEKRRALVPV